SNVYREMARAFDRTGNSSNNTQHTINGPYDGQQVYQTEAKALTVDKTWAKAVVTDAISYTATVKKNGVVQANFPGSFKIV
ncbi:hypothetical protein JQN42_24665, partial [Escherichia coli]|uniref:hypothetical protein n=1 Tax=Escherichia coli TaxID=562 RepID=UPI00193A24C4